MGILETIGIGALIFLIYKFLVKPRLDRVEFENNSLIEKVNILRSWHPEIREQFKKFEKEQHESAKWEEKQADSFFGDRGGYINIFNHPTFVFYQYQVEDFKNSIVTRISELEKDPIEKQRIQEIIENHKRAAKKQNEQLELISLQRRKNFITHKALMSSLFPNPDIHLTRENITKALEQHLSIDTSKASELLDELSDHETGIIFKMPSFKNDEIEEYWYCESQLLDKMEKASNRR